MLNPQTIFEFNQKYKQLQIHAGMGVTETNIAHIDKLCDQLANISAELCFQASPPQEAETNIIEIEEKPLEVALANEVTSKPVEVVKPVETLQATKIIETKAKATKIFNPAEHSSNG